MGLQRLCIVVAFSMPFIGCGKPSAPPATSSPTVLGMTKYSYLASDGGPHLVLPLELSRSWTGSGDATDPTTDYGRACIATTTARVATVSIGSGHALALHDPPLTAWGQPDSDATDIYVLRDWSTMNLDDLIDRAVVATPTASMTDTGIRLRLSEPDLLLMFAGSEPGRPVYDEFLIPLNTGEYQLLESTYSGSSREVVDVYRLVRVPIQYESGDESSNGDGDGGSNGVD